MRIAYIAAGAGAMYCGACARDATLARGLIARGHEVQIIPLYTPMKLDREDLPASAVYFGGINVTLQQAAPFLRWIPAVIDRLLDNPALLKLVSRFAIEVEAKKLGPMTVSMLAGKDGRQKKEVDRLLRHLDSGFRPEVINLTNSLLSGLAPELKRRFKVPVACTYQGEEGFVRDLPDPYRTQAQDLIRRNAQAIDLVICPSEAMAESVAEYLGVSRSRLQVIRTAVSPVETVSRHPGPFTVGYLSVIRPAKGLDLLVEALRILCKDQGRDVRLLIAGRVMNLLYWKELQQKIRRESLTDRVETIGEVDGLGKLDFMSRISVYCLPSRYAEPRGVAALEAMAAGVPVIVPDTGVYPELFAMGGGGVPVPANDAPAIARAIANLMDNPATLHELSAQARELMRRHCTPEQMVDATLAGYHRMVSAGVPVEGPVVVNSTRA